jgi:acetylornithine deacetylase/succinyl-diaminopimelate desuccinylase-like protein
MLRHEVFGGSTVVPTLLYVDQTSSNVIPAQTTVHLDWRAAPGETMQDARALIQRVLDETVEPGVRPQIELYARRGRAYTGYEEDLTHELAPFCLEEDDPILQQAHATLEQALEHPVGVGIWAFCTDGGHLYPAGIPCLGFGPGEESMAHVLNERIDIDQMVEATAGYMGLALHMGADAAKS